jgi:glycosyltransferase involved in cell wall biosynthesis
MHIAWLGKKSPFCGNVTYSREITQSLKQRGHRVSFIHFHQAPSPSYNQGQSEEEFGLPYHYKHQIYTLPKLTAYKQLKQSLERLSPDVVHASLTLSPLDFALPQLCQELKLPLVATFHPAFDHKLRNFTSLLQFGTYQFYAPFLAHYDRVIVFSQLQQDLLHKLGVPKQKIAIIPNGVDSYKYSPGFSTFKTQLNAEQIYLYQGRIAGEKNVDALLKAWKRCQMKPSSKLVIMGDGPMAELLQKDYGAADGVIWLGFIKEEYIRINVLRAADVFILPSLVEGLSLALLEAMACGVACLATDAGADGEVLNQGAGIVLETNQVTFQLQQLLPQLERDQALRQSFGERARARVLERYTLTNNIDRVEQLYHVMVNLPSSLESSRLVNS